MRSHLKEIRKINQHIIPRLFLSTGHVKADGYNIEAFSSLGEFVFNSERVQPGCGQADNLRYPENRRNALDFPRRWKAREKKGKIEV